MPDGAWVGGLELERRPVSFTGLDPTPETIVVMSCWLRGFKGWLVTNQGNVDFGVQEDEPIHLCYVVVLQLYIQCLVTFGDKEHALNSLHLSKLSVGTKIHAEFGNSMEGHTSIEKLS